MDALIGDEATQQKIRGGEANMQVWRDKVTAAGEPKSGKSENPGFLGPNYAFADQLKTPAEIGVRNDGSVDGIMRAVAGVNYYSDAIGFGEPTMLNKGYNHLSPMGIRYFLPTGATCSNGALMWTYIDNVPKGNLLGKRLSKAMQDMGLPGMKGLAPGVLEDARDALNPMPIFQAAIGSGYPKCKLVTLPVGDMEGRVVDPYDSQNVWIKGKVENTGKGPTQTRWVQDRDAGGNPVFMSQLDYENDKKLYYPDGSHIEGFTSKGIWEEYIDTQTLAGLVFAGLAVGLITFAHYKS
jgi:hypothetical protein